MFSLDPKSRMSGRLWGLFYRIYQYHTHKIFAFRIHRAWQYTPSQRMIVAHSRSTQMKENKPKKSWTGGKSSTSKPATEAKPSAGSKEKAKGA